MASDVHDIRPTEALRLDLDRVVAVYERLSDPKREKNVFDAVDQLDRLISGIKKHYRDGQFSDVCRQAMRLIAVAEDLGFIGVSEVARSVSTSARWRDGPAVAATVARLSRAAQDSVGALTDPCSIPC